MTAYVYRDFGPDRVELGPLFAHEVGDHVEKAGIR